MTKKRRDPFDLLEDIIDDPFEALGDVFDSLGNVFDDKTDLDSSGRQTDIRKLKADIAKMKQDAVQNAQNVMKRTRTAKKRPPFPPPNRTLPSGDAVMDVGNTGKKHKHKMTLKDNEGNKIKVTFNSVDDLSIRTTGDIDHDIMDEVKRHIREKLKPTPKDPGTEQLSRSVARQRARAEVSRHKPILWTRSWRGEKKNPLEFTSKSKVSVSGNSMFGRKYEVAVDGTTIYILKLEEMMERCNARGDLDVFVGMWSVDERAIMLKIFEGLEALKLFEVHHEATRKLISP